MPLSQPRLSSNGHGDDFRRIGKHLAIRAMTFPDLVDKLHAFNHLAKQSVLAIQKGGWVEANEELAVCTVSGTAVRPDDAVAPEHASHPGV